MLSIFPQFLDFNAVAVTGLRVVVGLIFLIEGYQKFPKKKPEQEIVSTPKHRHICKCVLSSIEMLAGSMLAAGFLTQAMALVLPIVSIKRAYNQFRHKAKEQRNIAFYILLAATSFAFLFFGPGVYGVDFPI